MIFENVLATLKLYNIGTGSIAEFHLENHIGGMKLEIATYCNLYDYPDENKQIDNILINLVVFNFLKSKNTTFLGAENEENKGNVKSINVGDFSVSYDTSDSVITDDFITSEINKYYLLLNKFRRLVW